MSGLRVSGNKDSFNLGSLTQLASKIGDDDVIRGKSEKKGVFEKREVVTLYKKTKTEGTHKIEHREGKQLQARSHISTALSNTLKSLNLPEGNQKRLLEQAFGSILERHTGGKGELTGSSLKSVVLEAHHAIGTTLNSTSNYNEATARKTGIPFPGTPISFKPMKEVNESISRWKDRPFTLTASNGDDHRTLFSPVPPQQKKDFDTEAMVGNMLQNLNELRGNNNVDLTEKTKVLSKFAIDDKMAKQLDPFDKNEVRNEQSQKIESTTYARKDDNANLDVLMLKFTTKSMAGWATGPLGLRLQEMGLQTGNPHGMGAVDQFDSCHIEMKPNNNFEVTSKISLDIRTGTNRDSTIGSVDITVTSKVNQTTGDTDISVNLGNLMFKEDLDLQTISKIYNAVNQKLPGGS